MIDSNYENFRRIVYGDEGAIFIPVCEKCGRFVKADEEIFVNGLGEVKEDLPNSTCSKCGRTRMIFEGFI